MATPEACEALLSQLQDIGGLRRGIVKALPAGTLPPGGPVLFLLSHFDEPLRAGRIAELVDVDMSVVSRHLAHLVDSGWVERTPNPDDGRSCLMRLTPEGRAVVDSAAARCLDILTDVLADWTDEDTRRLADLLSRLRAGIGRRAPADAGTSGAVPSGAAR